MSKRFIKRNDIDGWPLEDTKTKTMFVNFDKEPLLELMNGLDEKIEQLQRQNDELKNRQRINLTAEQLAEAAYWANPDNDPEQDDTEVVIEYMPERIAIDGEKMAAGDYLYYEECPEEGVLGPLGTEGFHGRIIVIDESRIKELELAAAEKTLTGFQCWFMGMQKPIAEIVVNEVGHYMNELRQQSINDGSDGDV